ncbi:MAG: DUF262 domain-containing protein [Gammaproteobacteria bacterium]|nr:DUF262 domain-containing protein [Gammaproteobacteria bacterium]
MTQSISQSAARTFTVVDLVAAAIEGRLRIPEFQRPLRWQWEDVRRLFDSIVKGYPIGNLLFWKRPAPAAEIKLGGLRLQARAFEEGWWVVDGQQRLTSLASALSEKGARDERFALSYDLRRKGFVRPSREEDGYIVPLATLFDLQQLIRWFTKDHPEASEKLDEASRVTRAIREYHVPAYLVDQDDEAVLRDIFDRLNNYGKRLSRAEVFSALHPGQASSVEPFSHFQKIAESIHDDRGFGIVDDDTVLHAVLARRGGNITRDIRVEFSNRTREPRDFGIETPEEAYRQGERALSRAVVFLQEEAGVPHFAFLPYRYLLVVLARFFAHFPEPSPRNGVLLRRWFWRAALIGPGPFSSSWTNAISNLSNRITANDEIGAIQRLLSAPIDQTLPSPSLAGFKTSTAASRIVLAALWALKPRSLLTGQPYDRQQLIEAIQPDATLAGVAQRILTREPENQRAWAANRILVLEAEDELPMSVADLLIAPPLGRAEAECGLFPSHALDAELVNALAQGDKTAFLEGRQRRIKQVVADFIERMAETCLEDTPPLDSFDLDNMETERDDALI